MARAGDSPAFRDGVAELNKWYFTEIKSTTLIWRCRPEVHIPEWEGRGPHPTRLRVRNPADHPISVKELVAAIPEDAWTMATIKEGSKGPLVCDFTSLRIVEARNHLPGPVAALLNIMGLKQAGKYEEAQQVIDQEMEQLLGMDAHIIKLLDDEGLPKLSHSRTDWISND